jgi:excisionase family DNA binding protein
MLTMNELRKRNVPRSTAYRLIADGKLDARKLGKRIMVTEASLSAFLRDLPPAQIRAPRAKAPKAPKATA